MNKINDKISLTLPVNPAYVSAARLTASSIANRMRFAIEEIEDIKAAVSEATAYIIRLFSEDVLSQLRITFDMSVDTMDIGIVVESSLKPEIDSEDMGLLMIKALTDSFEIDTENDNMKILMSKTHKAEEL